MITQTQLQLFIIFLIVTLGFIGVALPYPILSPLFLEHQYNLVPTYFSDSTKPFLLGITLACYPLGQFLSSPIIGDLSDKIGRKKILVLTLLGTAIGYLLCAFSIMINNIWLLIVSRFLTGLAEGNITIAQACATDMSNQVHKTKSFGIIYAAAALGYIIGPLLSGYLLSSTQGPNFSLPFFAATALSLGTTILVLFFFKEQSNSAKNILKSNFKKYISSNLKHFFIRSFQHIKEVWQDHKLQKLLIVHMILFAGIDLFYGYSPLYLLKTWHSSSTEISSFVAVFAISYSLSQATLVPLAKRLLTATAILFLSAVFSGVLVMICLACVQKYILYILFPTAGVFFSLSSTYIAVLISDSAEQNIQGKVIGVSQSIRVFNDASIVIIGGLLASLSASLPFIIAGCLMIAAGLFSYFFMHKNMNQAILANKDH